MNPYHPTDVPNDIIWNVMVTTLFVVMSAMMETQYLKIIFFAMREVFPKWLKYIESKDLRNKYEQKKVGTDKGTEKITRRNHKKCKKIKKYAASAMEQVKYNWRSTFDSGAALEKE